MKEIIPTIVPLSSEDFAAKVRELSFAPWLHIDAADTFAHNTTWIPEEGEMLPQGPSYEAHLMVHDQEKIGVRFAKAGAKRIIGHIEAFGDENVEEVFAAWKAAGATEVGLATKMDTPLEAMARHLPNCNCVLLMTINEIGKQGSPFDPRAQARVGEFMRQYVGVSVAVDGGLNEGTIPGLAQAGVDRFCVGAAISRAPEKEHVYKTLVQAANGV